MTSPMPDLGALLAQAQQMQQSMVQAQQEVESMHATGTAGGGLVTAVVDGSYDLVALTIAPDAVDLTADDALDDLADLVVAAVRDAKSEVERLATERMGAATSALSSLGASLGATGEPGGLGGLESLLPPGVLGPASADPDDTSGAGDAGNDPADR
jgi:DNA-binding YbaB/EbfC family protein